MAIRCAVELLEAWRAGDKQAGSQLVDRKHAMVVRFFRNKVAVVSDEADLVQRTFIALSQSRNTFADDAMLDAYLYGIAGNVLREYIRRKYKLEREQNDFAEVCIADLDGASMSSMVGFKHDLAVLVECLRTVSVEDQLLLELRFFEAATAATIAQTLGIPRGSVDGRIQRALGRLAAAVQARRGPETRTPTRADFERWAADIRSLLAK